MYIFQLGAFIVRACLRGAAPGCGGETLYDIRWVCGANFSAGNIEGNTRQRYPYRTSTRKWSPLQLFGVDTLSVELKLSSRLMRAFVTGWGRDGGMVAAGDAAWMYDVSEGVFVSSGSALQNPACDSFGSRYKLVGY